MKKQLNAKSLMLVIKQSSQILNHVQKPPIPLQVLTLLSEQKKTQF